MNLKLLLNAQQFVDIIVLINDWLLLPYPEQSRDTASRNEVSTAHTHVHFSSSSLFPHFFFFFLSNYICCTDEPEVGVCRAGNQAVRDGYYAAVHICYGGSHLRRILPA
jgi:hypothetical protein